MCSNKTRQKQRKPIECLGTKAAQSHSRWYRSDARSFALISVPVACVRSTGRERERSKNFLDIHCCQLLQANGSRQKQSTLVCACSKLWLRLDRSTAAPGVGGISRVRWRRWPLTRCLSSLLQQDTIVGERANKHCELKHLVVNHMGSFACFSRPGQNGVLSEGETNAGLSCWKPALLQF